MLLRYFYDTKLAQASYLVACQGSGEALVIDPARDIAPYLRAAEADGLRLVAAVETHIHADFVSGARELVALTDGTLVVSGAGTADWQYGYVDRHRHQLLRDGDTYDIGRVRLEALHTPGHTPEHLSYLLTDRAVAQEPMGLFSGDFVFVGDVGRPDLLEQVAGIRETAGAGAREVFASLVRFRELEDHAQVWPGHGAGSACGRSLGAVPSSTVGYERRTNWALQEQDEDRFVQALLRGQPEPPRYFGVMKRVNRDGPTVLGGVPLPMRLPFSQLVDALRDRQPVIDARPAGAFASSHIPGTINVPAGADFPTWAGWLVRYDTPFHLIVDDHAVADVAHDLHAIGLDNAAGYFETSAIDAWTEADHPVGGYRVAAPEEVAERVMRGNALLLDVRGESEHATSAIPGSEHLMLGYLADHVADLPRDREIVVHCSVGSRSAIAASLLRAHGLARVTNLRGGLAAWRAAGLPVIEPEVERS